MEKKITQQDRLDNIFKGDGNTVCFDCQNKSNKVTSVHTTFAVFLCCECAKHHKRFFEEFEERVLNVQNNKFNNFELNILEIGGNDKLSHLLKEFSINVNTTDLREKYMNRAVLYYRKWLLSQAKGDNIKNEKPHKKEACGPVEIEEFLELENEGNLMEDAQQVCNEKENSNNVGKNEHTKVTDERQHERPIKRVKGGEVRNRVT